MAAAHDQLIAHGADPVKDTCSRAAAAFLMPALAGQMAGLGWTDGWPRDVLARGVARGPSSVSAFASFASVDGGFTATPLREAIA
jgi:hypothetical protein